MAEQEQHAHTQGDHSQNQTSEEQEHRQRILREGVSSTTRSIIGAVAIKNDNVFFLAQQDGDVPLEHNHAYGLYYDDTRFLNGYELRMADVKLNTSLASAAQGCLAIFELTNPEIQMPNGTKIQQEQIGFKWERVIDASGLALCDLLTIENYQLEPVQFPISLRFQAGFESEFSVRSLSTQSPGKHYPPTWKDGALFFLYHGKDQLYRSLSIHLSEAPSSTEGTKATYQIDLQPRESKKITLFLNIAQSSQLDEVQPRTHTSSSAEAVKTSACQPLDDWLHNHAAIYSDNRQLDRIIGCSLRDLRVLLSRQRNQLYFAAGIPWFVALFGRDSLISSMQVLAYEPEVAEHTLRLLASYQGTKVNDWQDERRAKFFTNCASANWPTCTIFHRHPTMAPSMPPSSF